MRRLAILLVLPLVLVACGSDGNGNGNGEAGSVECDVLDEGKPAELAELEDGKTYSLVFRTNKGSFTVELDHKTSPCVSASMVGLAEKDFFNGTIFHRIVPGFVIQGGDPTGTGTGGPGYKTVDEPPADASYRKGVVAMAKAAQEPVGTAGSQFFVVTGDDAGLPPDYALLGKVTDGLDVVEQIGRLGGPAEQPRERVEIESVQVTTR